MTYAQIAMLIVVCSLFGLIFLIGLIASAVRNKKNAASGVGTFAGYYIGGRSTGGLTLAMTVIAVYLSAGTFIGGPGYAYEKGLGWAFLAAVQIPGVFMVLAFVAKRLGIVSRKIGAVTVNDILRVRYGNPAVVIATSVLMAFFFIVQMMAQLRGGAVLFQTITGVNYETALLLFGALAVLFTVFGGFSGQSAANVLLALLMIIGSIILLSTLTRASGNGSIAETMTVLHPGWDSVRGADGSLTLPYMLSFWIVTGLGVIGLPQTTFCGTAYRKTKALHRAIVIGMILLTFIVLVIHIVGAYSPLLISTAEVRILLGEKAGTDYIIPAVILKYCNPLTAGLFFAAPLAAVFSSVNALLLSGSSALIKDVYLNYMRREKEETEAELFRKSVLPVTFLLTILFFAAAWALLHAEPFRSLPIVELNLFAMGGMECVLFFPLVGGVFWKKGTASGAIASIAFGTGLYLLLTLLDVRVFGFLPAVPAFLLSGIVYAGVSLSDKRKAGAEVQRIFFTEL